VEVSKEGSPKGEVLTPAILTWLFRDEYFKRYNPLDDFSCMVAAALFTLENDGHISLRVDKRGKLLKKEVLVITKKSRFDHRKYGYLSFKISKLPLGGEMTVYDLVFKPEKKEKWDAPSIYLKEDILTTDLDMKTWAYLLGKPDENSIPIFLFREPHNKFMKEVKKDRLEPYREQALKLKEIFDSYVSRSKKLLKIIDRQCLDAFYDMKIPEW